jgi:hypothetical protein
MNGLSLITRGFVTPAVQAVVVQVPSIEPQQNLCKRSLTLPIPFSMTTILGIFQSDLIIRTAILSGIADLRANPWLLDYVFASLPNDGLTAGEYGEKERAEAKKWFLNTDIPVSMDYRQDDAKTPIITITLLESSEVETSIGDVNYTPQEDSNSQYNSLVGVFTPDSYSATTGLMVVPAKVYENVVLAVGMLVCDKNGRSYVIKDIIDIRTILLSTGINTDFTDATIRSASPDLITTIESATFKETYRIGVHAHGEPVYLTWLHSIVKFLLLRYKEVLLEGRGFERTTISSGEFSDNPMFDKEKVWSRYITISGYVRQFWPKTVSGKITNTGEGVLTFEQVGNDTTTSTYGDSEEQAWLAQDGLK